MKQSSHTAFSPNLLPLLGLALLALVALAPAALGQGVFFYGDANDYFARLFYSAARLRAGEVALWNPYLSLGGSHAADPAALAWYVPALVLFLVLPPPIAYNYTVIAHLFVAAGGTYLFARTLSLSRASAVLSAIVFGLSGFLIGHLQHLNIVIGLAWLPWIFFALQRYFQSRRPAFLVLGSLALGLQVLGGHSQMVLYGALAWASYAAFHVVRQWRAAAGRPALLNALAVGAIFVGGICLAAIFVVPFAELLGFTARSERITFDFATSFSFEPLRLITFFSPYFFGGNPGSVERGPGSLVEMSAYTGILPLVLAAVALWPRRAPDSAERVRHDPRVWFFGALALLALMLALGKYTPLYQLVYRLPVFGSVRAPARFMVLVVFSIAVLAGFGLESLRQFVGRLPFVFWLLPALFVFGLLLARALPVAPPETVALALRNPALYAAVFFALATGGLLVLWARGLAPPRVRVALTLALVALDLIFYAWNFRDNEVADAAFYFEPGQNARVMAGSPTAGIYYWGLGETKGATYLQQGQLDLYARAARAGLRQSLPMLSGIRSLQGYGTEPPAYAELVGLVEARRALDRQAAGLLALYGDTYVLTAQALDSPALDRVQRVGPVNLYRNHPGANLGRAALAFDALVFPTTGAVLASLAAGPPDPATVRLDAPSTSALRVPAASGSADMLVSEPEHVTVRVETDQPAWLVLNDTYYPGWTATVDGAPATILRANALVRAVAVPSGAHLVAFVYDPSSVKLGAVGSAVTLVVLGAVLLMDLRRARPAAST